MKTISAPALAHLRGELSTLAVCWTITKNNGVVIRSTEHDRDIEITTGALAGLYRAAANITASDARSSSDMSPDNMEVEGAFPDLYEVPDVTVADIEAGLFDNARVQIFFVNYTNPNQFQNRAPGAFVGIPERDSEGRYRMEVRGLAHRLSQTIGWTYGERCNVTEFGDARCGFDIAAATRDADVTAVTSRREFEIQITYGDPLPESVPQYFNGARLTFTSGPNAGYSREVKEVTASDSSGEVLLVRTWEEFPNDIGVGDSLTLPPSCDRTKSMCLDVHNNVENFRGYGVYIPGVLAIMKGPT